MGKCDSYSSLVFFVFCFFFCVHVFLRLSDTSSPLKYREFPLCYIATVYLIGTLKLVKNLGHMCFFSDDYLFNNVGFGTVSVVWEQGFFTSFKIVIYCAMSKFSKCRDSKAFAWYGVFSCWFASADLYHFKLVSYMLIGFRTELINHNIWDLDTC